MNIEGIEKFFKKVNDILITGFLIPSKNPKEIWFPYSIEVSRLLEPGVILAIKNFNSIEIGNPNKEEHDLYFSIYEVVDVTVQHYDILNLIENPQKVKLTETFEKFREDWYRSLEESEREDLKIIVQAVPHNYELHIPSERNIVLKNINYDYKFRRSNVEPIVGENVFLLENKYIEEYINGKIKESPTSFRAGNHQIFKNVSIYMDYYPLLNRHFGVFGFTGAGKSNLISTLISKSMLEAPSPANILVFDINNEYFGLLFDVLLEKDGHVIFLTPDTVSGIALDAFLKGYYNEKNFEEVLDAAAEEFIETVNFPDEVKNNEQFPKIKEVVKLLLLFNKIKIYASVITTKDFLDIVFEIVENNIKNVFSGTGSQSRKQYFKNFLNIFYRKFASNQNLNKHIYVNMTLFIKQFKKFVTGEEIKEFAGLERNYHEQIIKALNILEKVVESVAVEYLKSLEYENTITIEELVEYTHDKEGSLMIFLSENDNDLRNFAHEFGNLLYDIRKNKKLKENPLTLFLFEEADLFIPLKPVGDDKEKASIQKSKEIATTLARRGRKYKLGLGIATQRTRYLDTSIVAQLGTYFVSKLPRATDRQVISEGFGVEEKQLSETNHFLPGDWMVLTHVNALNLKATPVLISFENANDRLIRFLENLDIDKYLKTKEIDLTPPPYLDEIFTNISKEEIFEIFPILVE